MKTCSEIRRDNLELLIAEIGTIEALAEKTGTSSGYISQLRTQAPESRNKTPRNIGDAIARRIEIGMEKEVGWMDHDHSDREADVFKQLPPEVRAWLIKQGTPRVESAESPKAKRG